MKAKTASVIFPKKPPAILQLCFSHDSFVLNKITVRATSFTGGSGFDYGFTILEMKSLPVLYLHSFSMLKLKCYYRSEWRISHMEKQISELMTPLRRLSLKWRLIHCQVGPYSRKVIRSFNLSFRFSQ